MPLSTELYLEYSKNIIGHAVEFPTKFLCKEKLYQINVDMVQDIFT